MRKGCVLTTLGNDPHTQGLYKASRIARKAGIAVHILEEHDTVRSALDYLNSVPRTGRNNLILADAGGDPSSRASGQSVAVMELGYHHLAVVKARNGVDSLPDTFPHPAPPGR
jgi:hypothetical protein